MQSLRQHSIPFIDGNVPNSHGECFLRSDNESLRFVLCPSNDSAPLNFIINEIVFKNRLSF